MIGCAASSLVEDELHDAEPGFRERAGEASDLKA
jgi:hypothetical protein